MNLNHLRGSLVALVTPFDQEGNPDFERLGYLIDWHLAAGTDGIVILGTTGESSTMTQEEDDAVCKFTVERVSGRIPVIAGSGSNCTQSMLERSLKFQELGANGLLLIAPYYNKANEGKTLLLPPIPGPAQVPLPWFPSVHDQLREFS